MPSRSGFDAVLVDSQGVPMSNISVTVLKTDGSPAVIYQSKSGGPIKAQPIITDSSNGGLIQFWADPGYYQVRATDLEVPARIATRFIPFDAVAGDMNGGIDSDQVSLTDEITSSMLQNNSVTTNKIANSQVTTAKIADSQVTTSKLADGSVTTSKIGDGQVTAAKIATGALTVSDGSVTTTKIVDGAVTESKLENNAVTNSKLLNGSVTTDKLANSSVTAAKVASQAILSGALKITTFTNSGSSSWTSSTPSNHVVSQVSSVSPGIYLVIGELSSTNVSVVGPSIATSGGSATLTQAGEALRTSGTASGITTVTALVQVTSTTTVQVIVGKGGPSGSVQGAINLFGISAS